MVKHHITRRKKKVAFDRMSFLSRYTFSCGWSRERNPSCCWEGLVRASLLFFLFTRLRSVELSCYRERARARDARCCIDGFFGDRRVTNGNGSIGLLMPARMTRQLVFGTNIYGTLSCLGVSNEWRW